MGEAVEAMQAFRDEAQRQAEADIQSAETVPDYLMSWLDSAQGRIGRDLKESTWRAYEVHIMRHFVPHLDCALSDLDREMLGAIYRDLEEDGNTRTSGGLSRKTVWNIHLTLHKALQDAVDSGLLARNPANSAYTAPKRQPEIKAWDADELRAFVRAAAGDRLAALWRLAATTGMRRGEIIGLRWSDVDLTDGTLSVVQARVRGLDGFAPESTKTDRGRRSVDLDPRTVDSLKRHRKQQMEERLEAGSAWVESGLVFTRTDGLGLDGDVVSQKFNRMVRNLPVRRIPFHGLRHTVATLWLKSGEPGYVVSRRLGHESEAFTEKQYAHVLPGQQRAAATRFATMLDDDGSPSARHQNPA